MLEIGSLLDGKYKILNEIGHGGMSVVYLALNERANKTWAVKEVRKDGGNDTTVVSQNLVAETEMLKKLNHPNLPSIIDVIDKDDSFIIVMDYIEGNSLQDLLDADGPQHPEKVIEWAKQLCDVLGYLHSRRPPIIYRDMKPANVMLKPTGDVTLIDFGTAREYKYANQADTTYLGTRGYAAPEQFGGRGQTDARTDIYTLGATMYHLVTGYSPADTNFEILPIGNFIPQLKDSGLEKVIKKCCQADPNNRYQSCAELMYALDHIHDEDIQAVKLRNRRWRVFLGCAILSLLMLIGGIGCQVMYANSRGGLYEQYIQKTSEGSDFESKAEWYKKALDLDPVNTRAWDGFINDIRNIDHEMLSKDEYNAILKCINSVDNDPNALRSSLQALQAGDKEKYAEVNYNLGYIIFFRYTSGRSNAYTYLKNAKDSGLLQGGQASILEMIYTLAEREREKKASGGNTQTGFNLNTGYNEYWQALSEMTTDLQKLQKDSGDYGYPIAVCNELAIELGSHIVDYAGSGVTQLQMNDALNNVKSYLSSLTGMTGQSTGMSSRIEEVSRNVVEAEAAVSKQFSIIGNDGSIPQGSPQNTEDTGRSESQQNTGLDGNRQQDMSGQTDHLNSSGEESSVNGGMQGGAQ